jgi:hypothetical protein
MEAGGTAALLIELAPVVCAFVRVLMKLNVSDLEFSIDS